MRLLVIVWLAGLPPAAVADATINQLSELSHRLHTSPDARSLSDNEVIDTGNKVLELLDQFPDDRLRSATLNKMSRAYAGLGDNSAALQSAERANTLAIEIADVDQQALAQYNLALAYWYSSEQATALQHAEAALRMRTAQGDTALPELATVHTLRGAIYRSLSDYDAALREHLQARDIALLLGDETALARSRNNIGLIYWNTQRHEEAWHQISQALTHYRNEGLSRRIVSSLSNLGLIEIELGKPRSALESLGEALQLIDQDDIPRTRSRLLSNIGYAYETLGQVDLALSYYQQSLDLRKTLGDDWGISRSLGSIGRLRLEKKEFGIAETLLTQALRAAENAGALREQSVLQALLADLFEQTQRPAEALSALKLSHTLELEIDDDETQRTIHTLESQVKIARQELQLSQQAQQQNLLVFASVVLVLSILGLLYFLRARAKQLQQTQSANSALMQASQQLQESEQRYRNLFNDAVVAKLVVDQSTGVILDANRPAAQLCDLPQSALIGQPVATLEPAWLCEAISQYRGVSNSDISLTKQWTGADDRIHHSEFWLSPVVLQEVDCVLVTIHDITEAHQLEEDRLRIDKLESLGLLAGGIAHDYNNSMAAILGQIELAQLELPAESEVQNMLSEAQNAVEHSVQLTSNLLTFAKGGEPQRELCDISMLLRACLQLVQQQSGVQLELQLDNQLWSAEVDPAQFKQLISNLLINSLQAVKLNETRRSGQIRLSATNHQADQALSPAATAGRYIRIEVSDNGPGIDRNIFDKILDPYFTTKPDGSGLGLASAYAITTRHSGWLTFSSEPNQGTTFTVYLPAQLDQPNESPKAATDIVPGSERVLVMDDDPAVQRVYQKALEQMGYVVDIVDDGTEATTQYLSAIEQQEPYDLVIMDLTVPGGMGGKQAMQEILKHDPAALGIVASGYSNDPVMADCESAGFAVALNKPFTLLSLAQALRQALGRDTTSEDPDQLTSQLG